MTVGEERRQAVRSLSREQHGVVQVRVRPGHEASLLNISSRGAAIDSGCRLLPGSVAELQLDTPQGRVCARGRVVRCTVAAVQANRVVYRAALCFEQPLASMVDRSPE